MNTNEISNTPDLIAALSELPDLSSDFHGRSLIRLAPNTTFEISETIRIRKKILLDGQGSVLKMVGSGPVFQIGENYTDCDAIESSLHDTTYSLIKDLDLVGKAQGDHSDIGIRNLCHGLRLSNIRFRYFKIGIETDGHHSEEKLRVHNSNNTSFRDLHFLGCGTAMRFTGKDASVCTVSHCEIVGCETGVELDHVSYSTFLGVYTEATKNPVRQLSNPDYSTWISCGSEGNHLSDTFKSGTVLGGNMVTGAKNVRAIGDRIGSGDSRIHFNLPSVNDSKKGIRVFIPGVQEGNSCPITFAQYEIQNVEVEEGERSQLVQQGLHGIFYSERGGKGYGLGPAHWLLIPDSEDSDIKEKRIAEYWSYKWKA